LDYMGVDADDFDGETLRPLIEDDEDEWTDREAILAEEAHTQRRRAVRTREYKYIRSLEDDLECRYCKTIHGANEELYDLVQDEHELENLADKHPETCEEMWKVAKSHAISYRSHESTDKQGDVTYEDEDIVADRLEALGYK